MLLEILPDLIRGSTTTISLMILLPILSKAKIEKKLYLSLSFFIITVDLIICAGFYINYNYTGLVYYSLLFYLLIVIGFKFLFKDKVLQWIFSSVTVLNVYAIIVIASYYLSHLFSEPEYAVTIIRLFLFALMIVFFKKYLRPLFLEVSENWGSFLLPIIGILANYLYIMLSLGDVENSMDSNIIYFFFLTAIAISTYIAIFFSLKSLRIKFLLREENIKRKANEDLLKSEILANENNINAAKQTRHDIRHHNSLLSEYLYSGDIEGAKNYLKIYDDHIVETTFKEFSKNPIANAVFRIYERHAIKHNIEYIVQAEADTYVMDRLPDIGIILSNILENAVEACKEVTSINRYIHYLSYVKNGSILIEIRNRVESSLRFEDGLPVTTKKDGGTGLLSVKSAIEKSHGMLEVKQENHEFLTRIILPFN